MRNKIAGDSYTTTYSNLCSSEISCTKGYLRDKIKTWPGPVSGLKIARLRKPGLKIAGLKNPGSKITGPGCRSLVQPWQVGTARDRDRVPKNFKSPGPISGTGTSGYRRPSPGCRSVVTTPWSRGSETRFPIFLRFFFISVIKIFWAKTISKMNQTNDNQAYFYSQLVKCLF